MRFPIKLKIVLPWHIKTSFIKKGVEFYALRIKRYAHLEIVEKKIKSRGKRPENIKKAESNVILSAICSKDYVIVLDEGGNKLNSLELAKFLQDLIETRPEAVFLIGGAFGLSKEVLKRADFKLSLSHFTLEHELALLVLMEQLYRAFTILSGQPYHK